MSQYSAAATSQSTHFYGRCDFTFWSSLFADDCALIFRSRAELVEGPKYFYLHMKKLGLNMHVGTADDPISKTVAIYFQTAKGKLSDGNTSNIDMVDDLGNPCHVAFDSSIKYLGSIIHQDLTSDVDIDARLKSAQQAFGALCKDVLKSNRLNLTIKGKVFNTAVMSTLLYGCESWTMTATLHGKLSSFYNRCVRRMCRCVYWVTTRCQKLHSWELRKRLGLGSFDDYYVSRVLKWLGYVSTLPMHRLPRLLMNASCVGGGCPVIMGKYRTNFNRCLDAVGETQETWMQEAADPIAWAERVRVVSQPLYKRKMAIS